MLFSPQIFSRSSPTGAGRASDPNFSSVKLLLGFEGTNGSTGAPGMTDESSAAHGTGAHTLGGATISTAQFQFGTSSFSAAGGDTIRFPDSADWAFGTGLFTVECWIRPTAVTGTQFIIAQWNSAGNLAWVLYQNAAALAWNVSTTGTDNLADISGGTLVANTWQAIAIDYDGSKYRAYINGTMVGSSVTARNIFDSTNLLAIGANSAATPSFPFTGNIDEVRLTKGVARYASDSGYTPATAPFPRS
jgi:hypothetical protein